MTTEEQSTAIAEIKRMVEQMPKGFMLLVHPDNYDAIIEATEGMILVKVQKDTLGVVQRNTLFVMDLDKAMALPLMEEFPWSSRTPKSLPTRSPRRDTD